MQKYKQDQVDPTKSGMGFSQFASGAARAAGLKPAALTKTFKDAVPEIGMTKDEYSSLSADQREDARKRMLDTARQLGVKISQDQLKQFLPDVEVKRTGFENNPGKFDRERIDAESFRMETDTELQKLKKDFGMKDQKWQQWPDPKARAAAAKAIQDLRIARGDASVNPAPRPAARKKALI